MKGSVLLRGPVSRVLCGLVLGFSLQQSQTASAEVVGGYVDSGDKRAVVVTQETTGARAVAAFSVAPTLIGRDPRALAGRLIAVDADGNWGIVPRVVEGRLVISPPSGTSSKVVFLDARNRIIGGMGLTASDFSAITFARGVPSQQELADFASPAGAAALFSDIHDAGRAVSIADLRYERDRHRLLRQQLSNNPLARDLIDSIRYAAVQGDALGDEAPVDLGIRGLIRQLYGRMLGADGKMLVVGGLRQTNGNTVLLGQISGGGDNGGVGGTEGLISGGGDNGGGGGTEGLISSGGDNGGGGGTEGFNALPLPKSLSIQCVGATLYVMP